jgi:hypothetical protein
MTEGVDYQTQNVEHTGEEKILGPGYLRALSRGESAGEMARSSRWFIYVFDARQFPLK